MTVLIEAIHEWYCPACGKTDQTKEPRPHSRVHVCPKTRFLTIPFQAKGTKAKVEVKEREDYVGREVVTLDPEKKRPVMSVVTTRDNGQDAQVYAGLAQGGFHGEG